jgi:PAS domain S-box-containing protein
MRDATGKVTGGINMLLDITERKQIERTTGLLAAIVDSSDDAIVSKRLDGTITSWNKSAERLFGYDTQEAVGQHISLIIPHDRLDEEASIIERLRRGIRVDHFETVRRRKDGSLVDISVTISPVRDSSGTVIGASKVARDIGERKRAEQLLARSAREQTSLFTLADQLQRAASEEDIFAAGLEAICTALQCDRAAILLADEAGVTRFVNWRGLSDVYRRLTEGYSPWQPAQTNPDPVSIENVSDSDLTDSMAAVMKAEGAAALVFIPLVCANKLIGHCAIYFDQSHRFTDSERDVSTTIARQIAFSIDRVRAEAALRTSEERFRVLSNTLDAEVRTRTKELEERNAELVWRSEQLRDLSRRMIRVQDDERRYMARELHDSAGQTLTVLGLSLAALMNKLSPELKREAEDTHKIVQQLSQEIRTTSYLLHPPLLDEAGLGDALNWFIDGLVSRSNLEIGLIISDNLGRLSPELELVIFRLVQECLTNIHRHSGSKSATIRIARQPETVVLQIEDNGKGIPAEKLTRLQSTGSGVGIRGMMERVRQFDGEMKIKSDSSGTTIAVTLPLSHGEKAAQPPQSRD